MKYIKKGMTLLLVAVMLFGYVPVARAADPVYEVSNAIFKMSDPSVITYANRDTMKIAPDTGYDAVLALYNKLTVEEKNQVTNSDKLRKWIEAYYDVGIINGLDRDLDLLFNFATTEIVGSGGKSAKDIFDEKVVEYDEWYRDFQQLSADGKNKTEAKTLLNSFNARRAEIKLIEDEIKAFLTKYTSDLPSGSKVYYKFDKDILLSDKQMAREYIGEFSPTQTINKSAINILKDHYMAYSPDPNLMETQIQTLESATTSSTSPFIIAVETRLQKDKYLHASNPDGLTHYEYITDRYNTMVKDKILVSISHPITGQPMWDTSAPGYSTYVPPYREGYENEWEGIFKDLIDLYIAMDYRAINDPDVQSRKADLDLAMRDCLIVLYPNRVTEYEVNKKNELIGLIANVDRTNPAEIQGVLNSYLALDNLAKAYVTEEYIQIKEMEASVDGYVQANDFITNTETNRLCSPTMNINNEDLMSEKDLIIKRLQAWKTDLNFSAKEKVKPCKDKLLTLLNEIKRLEKNVWEYRNTHAEILNYNPNDLVYEFHRDKVKAALDAYNRTDDRIKDEGGLANERNLVDEKVKLDALVEKMYELEAKNFLNSYEITRKTPMPAEWDSSTQETKAVEALSAFSRLSNEVKTIIRQDTYATEFKSNLNTVITNLLIDSKKLVWDSTRLVDYDGPQTPPNVANIPVKGMEQMDRLKVESDAKTALSIVSKAEKLSKSIENNISGLTITDKAKITTYKTKLTNLLRDLGVEAADQLVAKSAREFAEKHNKTLETIDDPTNSPMWYPTDDPNDNRPKVDNWNLITEALNEYNSPSFSNDIKDSLAAGIKYNRPDGTEWKKEINETKLKGIKGEINEKIDSEKEVFEAAFSGLHEITPSVPYGKIEAVAPKIAAITALNDKAENYIDELKSRIGANYTKFELFRDDANKYLLKLVELEKKIEDNGIKSSSFIVLDNLDLLMNLKRTYGDLSNVKDEKMKPRVDDALGTLDSVMSGVPEAIRRLLDAFERDNADLLSGRKEVVAIKNWKRADDAKKEIDKIIGYLNNLENEEFLKNRGNTIKGKIDNLLTAIEKLVDDEARAFLNKHSEIINTELRKLPEDIDPLERKEIYEEYLQMVLDGIEDEDAIWDRNEEKILERAAIINSKYSDTLFSSLKTKLENWIEGNEDYEGALVPPEIEGAELFIPTKNREHNRYEWTIRFNQELNGSTISNVLVYDSEDWSIHNTSTRLTSDGKGIIIRPNQAYKSDIKYYILIPKTVLSTEGKGIVRPLKMIFRAY